MNESTIYLKPTRRQKLAQSFGHVLPGVVLLAAGVESLFKGETGHLPLACQAPAPDLLGGRRIRSHLSIAKAEPGVESHRGRAS